MTTPKEATREALPEMPVVAWLYTHKISGATCTSDWCWPADHAIREFHLETHLVRLTDAQSALESERQAHAAEVERLRGDAGRKDAALRLCKKAISHWLCQYCPDLMAESHVARSVAELSDHGTLAYTAEVNAAIDQAIARGKT